MNSKEPPPSLYQPKLFLLVFLLTASIACKAVTNLGREIFLSSSSATATRLPVAIYTPSALTAAPSDSPLTLTPVPSSTRVPSPTLSSSPTPPPTAAEWQLDVFEDLWSVVNEEYLYRDFNGLNWDAVHEEYLGRIQSGLTSQEFYSAMDEMIYRLGDDHSFFLDPTQVKEEEDEMAGELEYVGIGILITTEPERNRVIVLLTYPGSPADRAGLRPRDIILEVDGTPVTGTNEDLERIIRGSLGSEIVLTVKSPGEPSRKVQMTREPISGPIHLPYQVLNTPTGQRIGYILLPTFADGTVSEQVGEALQSMSEAGSLDGLVLDNRWNNGGVDTMLRGTLSYFVDGLVGYFVDIDGDRPLAVRSKDVSDSQGLKLVVLIGPDTASFGEIFAGILSDLGRAYLIGSPTLGNVEILWGYDFSDGSRAWIAHDTFRPLNNPDQDWEQTGVIPDEVVQAPWEEFTLEEDPVVQAALDYFDQVN